MIFIALNNEDLLAISQLLDTKLKPIKDEQGKIKNELAGIKEEQTQIREEQIQIREEQTQIREELTKTNEELAKTNKELAKTNEELAKTKEEQRKINLVLEHEIRHNINLLVENYVPAANRYEEAASQIEGMQMDIGILKK